MSSLSDLPDTARRGCLQPPRREFRPQHFFILSLEVCTF